MANELTPDQWFYDNLQASMRLEPVLVIVDKYVRSFWGLLLIFGVIVFGTTSLTRLAYDAVIYSSNISQIEELNRRSLQRAELIIGSAVATLSKLAEHGLEDCSRVSLMEIRRASVLEGSLKDIQVLDSENQLLCSGYSLSDDLGIAGFNLDKMYISADSQIALYDITRSSDGLVGVGWRLQSGNSFLAVLNLDTLLLDVFPEALRDHARADLTLGGDVEITSHIPLAANQPPPEELIEITSASEQFPLITIFNVHTSALLFWNREAEPFVVVAGVLLGLVLGGLSISVLRRPRDPDEEICCALDNGEFVPFMQPVFTIGSAEIVGCEVLTRWIKPDGTLIPPHRFIPLAEDNGLIIPITRSIMKSALSALKPLLASDRNFKIAFNIVPADLVSQQFSDDLCKIVKDAGVARRQIVLEITERQGFTDMEVAIRALSDLRELGFKVSLDDTGTGHNGLSNVQQLGADIIKIDKHFVDRIGVDLAATTIVQMLVRLARELDMRTVAEGIETELQMKILLECKVDEGQGFLVSPPVPADEFLALVAKPVKATSIAVAA